MFSIFGVWPADVSHTFKRARTGGSQSQLAQPELECWPAVSGSETSILNGSFNLSGEVY